MGGVVGDLSVSVGIGCTLVVISVRVDLEFCPRGAFIYTRTYDI